MQFPVVEVYHNNDSPVFSGSVNSYLFVCRPEKNFPAGRDLAPVMKWLSNWNQI